MIIIQFSFEVPDGRIQEFMEYSSKVLKKTWESYSCKSYTAYRSVGKRIRPDQIIKKNEIVEQLVFHSLEDAERMFEKKNLRPGDVEAARSYDERFHVRNMQCRFLEMLQ